jgi:hypothetical protein
VALFTAFNCALDAATTMAAGTSYATGTKVAIQLAPPSGVELRLVEWGVSFNGNAAGTPAVCTLVQMSAAANGTVTSLSGLVKAVGDRNKTTSLTMGTTSSGYGATALTSSTGTMEKQFAMAFVGPTSQYEKQFPLGRDYVVDTAKFCQLRINTAATYTAFAYIVFEEI